MTDFPLSGRGWGHVSNFYIVDSENFATVSRRCKVVGVQMLSTNSSAVSLWIAPMMVERIVAECKSLLYDGRL